MDKNTINSYLEFFAETIKEIKNLHDDAYDEYKDIRDYFIDKADYGAYEKVTGDFSYTFCYTSGKLNFLEDAFTRFVNELKEEAV